MPTSPARRPFASPAPVLVAIVGVAVTTALVLSACSTTVVSPSVAPASADVASNASSPAGSASGEGGDASEEPCPSIPTEGPAAPALPADIDAETRLAVEKRIEYGLRHDLDWVRLVAANPRAVMDFGVPMLPEETERLFARNDLGREVRRALDEYGHAEQLAGLYLDNELGGVVVVLWTGDVAALEAGVRPILPRCHPVLFRSARWSEAELRRWQERIAEDSDWFAGIPAAIQGVGADVTENAVVIDISSANPVAADVIVAHYDAPPGMIRVRSDGTGAALLPWGTIKGRVVTVDGRVPPPGNLEIVEAPGGPIGHCGTGDMGFGVDDDGTFEYRCQVGQRTIHVVAWDGNGDRVVVGEATATVTAGGVATVRIRIDRPIQP